VAAHRKLGARNPRPAAVSGRFRIDRDPTLWSAAAKRWPIGAASVLRFDRFSSGCDSGHSSRPLRGNHQPTRECVPGRGRIATPTRQSPARSGACAAAGSKPGALDEPQPAAVELGYERQQARPCSRGKRGPRRPRRPPLLDGRGSGGPITAATEASLWAATALIGGPGASRR
jgi:hypothetical protein